MSSTADADATKSALASSSLRSHRSASSRRYAALVPGGVRVQLGKDEPARDRALAQRAEYLRQQMSTIEGARSASKAYEFASVLQEQAERRGASEDDVREELLARACDAYGKAQAIELARKGNDDETTTTSVVNERDDIASAHAVLYNWAIALGDRAARATKKPNDSSLAIKLWDEAIDKYEKAACCARMSANVFTGGVTTQQATQGLNNLGLAQQARAQCVDFASCADVEDLQRARLVRVGFLQLAVGNFRRALRREPCFDRGVYNLGTATYALNAEFAALRATAGATSGDAGASDEWAEKSKEYAASSAVYVAFALANAPTNSVFKQSFALVKHLLPSPNALVGTFAFRADFGASRGDADVAFVTVRVVLDAHRVCAHSIGASEAVVDIALADVASCEPMEDSSLPSDVACFAMASRDAEAPIMLFTSSNARARDLWVDGIILASSLARRHRQRALEAVLAHES